MLTMESACYIQIFNPEGILNHEELYSNFINDWRINYIWRYIKTK